MRSCPLGTVSGGSCAAAVGGAAARKEQSAKARSGRGRGMGREIRGLGAAMPVWRGGRTEGRKADGGGPVGREAGASRGVARPRVANGQRVPLRQPSILPSF